MDTIVISPTEVHTKVIRRNTRDNTVCWITADSSIVPRPCANHWTDQHQVIPFTHITGDGESIALYVNQKKASEQSQDDLKNVSVLCSKDQYTTPPLQAIPLITQLYRSQ